MLRYLKWILLLYTHTLRSANWVVFQFCLSQSPGQRTNHTPKQKDVHLISTNKYLIHLWLWLECDFEFEFEADTRCRICTYFIHISGSAKNIPLTYRTNHFFVSDVATFCHNIAAYFFAKIVVWHFFVSYITKNRHVNL